MVRVNDPRWPPKVSLLIPRYPYWLLMTPYLPPCEPFRKVLQKTDNILQKTDKTHFIFLGLREHSSQSKTRALLISILSPR